MRLGAAATALLGALALSGLPAHAIDTIRIGKPANAWTFTPLDVGLEGGIFAKHGLKLEIITLGGDAKVQQALAANGVDLAVGSGPGMGFAVKGVPAKAVAAIAGPPDNMSIVIDANAPQTDIKEMKGKKFAVTTAGSLTEWLLHRAALAQGWKYDDLVAVPLGTFESSYAAFKTGQVDGIVTATEINYMLEQKKEAKIIVNMGAYAPKFHTHVIFARNELIDKKPDLVRQFLGAWFETIAWMKANKGKTIEISARALKLPPPIVSRTYDVEIAMLQDDGHFDPEAIKIIKSSLIDMHILDSEPADGQMFTTYFVQ
jgi:ABC-type nitrate/sulfonate/bicarbonate transport system substrate-binding protein